MPTSICPECRSQADTVLTHCPHCGFPIQPSSQNSTKDTPNSPKTWVVLVVASIVVLAMATVAISIINSGNKEAKSSNRTTAKAISPPQPKAIVLPEKNVNPNDPPPLTAIKPKSGIGSTGEWPTKGLRLGTPKLPSTTNPSVSTKVEQPAKNTPENLPAARLEAYYPFNNNLQDSSGKNRHGKYAKPAKGYVPGKKGQGIAMTSSTSIALPLGYFTEGTVSLWVKPEYTGKINNLLSAHGSIPDYVTIIFEILKEGYPHTAINTAPFNWQHSDLMRQVRMPNQQWHHIAFTWGTRGLILYLNGQPIAVGKSKKDSVKLPVYPNRIPGAPVAPVRLNKNTKEWRLGAMAKSRDNAGFVGVLDEVRIYSKALTQQEISALAR